MAISCRVNGCRSSHVATISRTWFRSDGNAWRAVRGLVAAVAGTPRAPERPTRRGFVLAGLVAALLAAPATAYAHKPSDAHVQLAIANEGVTGSLAVALRDLDGALDLDANGDGTITWAEAQAAAPRITTYARERLVVDGCTLAFGAGALVDFSDGAYWAMPITGTCSGEPATATYGLLFDIDAQHRGIVQIATARETRTVVARDATPIALPVAPSPLGYAAAGFARAWTSAWGLIVLALLVLPLVVRAAGVTAWSDRSTSSAGRALAGAGIVRSLATVSSSFVLGCAATLVLASSHLVMLPSADIVAPVVAGSAIFAGVINLLRVRAGRRDFAFELGLVHGFGAALWLDSTRAVHVLPFAAGVALAQIAFVAVAAALLYLVHRTFAYRALVWGGSAIAAVGTLAWMCLA